MAKSTEFKEADPALAQRKFCTVGTCHTSPQTQPWPKHRPQSLPMKTFYQLLYLLAGTKGCLQNVTSVSAMRVVIGCCYIGLLGALRRPVFAIRHVHQLKQDLLPDLSAGTPNSHHCFTANFWPCLSSHLVLG